MKSVVKPLALVMFAVSTPLHAEQAQDLLVSPASFNKTIDGQTTALYTLKNSRGMWAQVTNYGAKLVTLIAPDRSGNSADVVLGYDNIDRYLTANPNFGAIVGRYANRIANATFSLNGRTYQLAKNDGPNSLHGGVKSFRHVVWSAAQKGDNAVTLRYLSKDGEEGYPGNLDVSVTYTLTEDNELRIDYLASTDQNTVVNLTNHAFFNMAGQGNGDVLMQTLQVNASRYTKAGTGYIPTGEISPVAGTPLDFTKPTPVGDRIHDDFPELRMPATPGYDQNFVLDKAPGELGLAAVMRDPKSGRVMELYTTEPGLQVYSGQNSNGTGGFVGKRGVPYQTYTSLCLEPQHFPDSPNHPEFPSTVLLAGNAYTQTSIYRFTIDR